MADTFTATVAARAPPAGFTYDKDTDSLVPSGSETAPPVVTTAPAAPAPTQGPPGFTYDRGTDTWVPAGTPPAEPPAKSAQVAKPKEEFGPPTAQPYGYWQNQPPHQWMQDLAQDLAGAGQTVASGATATLDQYVIPAIVAATRVATAPRPTPNTPPLTFSDAFDQEQKRYNEDPDLFKSNHPTLAKWLNLGGMVFSPANKLYAPFRPPAGIPLEPPAAIPGTRTLTAPLTTPPPVPAPPGAVTVTQAPSTTQKVVDFARNTAVTAGQAAPQAYTETKGTTEDKARAAMWAGLMSPALTAFAPALTRGAVELFTPPTAEQAAAYAAGRKPVSTDITQQAGREINQTLTTPGATVQQAPIPNFPLGLGGATGDRGAVALEGQAAAADQAAQIARERAQQTAIEQAATAPGASQLVSRRMTPSEAMEQGVVPGARDAMQVFKDHENMLWNRPGLSTHVNMRILHNDIRSQLDALPFNDRSVLSRHSELNTIDLDLRRLEAEGGATVADINAIRSDVLNVGRTAEEAGDANGARVAKKAAAIISSAIERNPELLANRTAWNQYKEARDFTAQKWDVFGKPGFERLLDPNASNLTTGRNLFGFGGTGTTGGMRVGEAYPKAFSKIDDLLQNVQRQWNMVAPPGMNPAVVAAARDRLKTGLQDFIGNSLMDTHFNQTTGKLSPENAANLHQWVVRNRDWLERSNIYDSNQLNLIDRLGQSGRMAGLAFTEAGAAPGSDIYQKLIRGQSPGAGNRIIDIFTQPVVRRASAAIGGAAAAVGGHFLGEILGTLGTVALGAGTERAVSAALSRIPNQQMAAEMTRLINNPETAKDLMRPMTPQGLRNTSPAFRTAIGNILRGVIAQGTGQLEGASSNYDRQSATPPRPESSLVPTR